MSHDRRISYFRRMNLIEAGRARVCCGTNHQATAGPFEFLLTLAIVPGLG
jgi:hypothetical protein